MKSLDNLRVHNNSQKEKIMGKNKENNTTQSFDNFDTPPKNFVCHSKDGTISLEKLEKVWETPPKYKGVLNVEGPKDSIKSKLVELVKNRGEYFAKEYKCNDFNFYFSTYTEGETEMISDIVIVSSKRGFLSSLCKNIKINYMGMLCSKYFFNN